MALHMHQTVCPGLGWENQLTGRTQMNTMLLRMYVKFQDLRDREEGQDLVEYALVLALIAGIITASNRALANVVSTVFSNLTTLFSATV